MERREKFAEQRPTSRSGDQLFTWKIGQWRRSFCCTEIEMGHGEPPDAPRKAHCSN